MFLYVEVSVTSYRRCQGGGLRTLSRRLETQTRTFEMQQQSTETLALLCEGSPQAT
jgi:hypothetical protein